MRVADLPADGNDDTRRRPSFRGRRRSRRLVSPISSRPAAVPPPE
jgi:hypothetical protein